MDSSSREVLARQTAQTREHDHIPRSKIFALDGKRPGDDGRGRSHLRDTVRGGRGQDANGDGEIRNRRASRAAGPPRANPANRGGSNSGSCLPHPSPSPPVDVPHQVESPNTLDTLNIAITPHPYRIYLENDHSAQLEQSPRRRDQMSGGSGGAGPFEMNSPG